VKIIISIDPICFPLTGIGRYTYELIRHLNQNYAIDDLAYFSGRRVVNELPMANQTSLAVSDLCFSTLKRWVQHNPVASEAYRQLLPFIQRHVYLSLEIVVPLLFLFLYMCSLPVPRYF